MILRSVDLTKSNSFFLFGARGTGKSSLLRKLFSDTEAVWVDLLDPELCDRLSAYPNRLLDMIDGQNKKWVVIDEIQKVPQLLEIVHQKIFKKEFLFALTGSSARKIKRGASNLLAGRAFVFTLFPFTSVELGEAFQLQRALEYGTLPEVWNFNNDLDRKRYLKSYATTFVKEEIIAEQIVRKLTPFRRFLEASAICNGEIANFSNIAKDISSDPKTVSNYYEILEDTLLAFSLPSFGTSIRKRQKKAKKILLF
jgi:predicted AAA+ superfamily ATPase